MEYSLKWDLKTYDVSLYLESSGAEQKPVVTSCEHCNEVVVFMKDEEFLDYL